MLKFNVQQQQIAENTVIDQIILETALGDQTISVNQFKGAVVVDPNLGNYVVIDFTVTDTAAMNIGRIRLMHGQTPVAISEDKQLLIVKEDHKNLKIRLAAQFAGAENCKFNTTSVNLPYATPFREGVVRFTNGDEINKSGTVYSAADVDAKIDAVTESLGNLKDYAKINAENTFAENNTFTKNITVNGEINGGAVATKGLANEKDTLVVSLGFANDKYLSQQDASDTYLTKNDAATTYLSKADANTAAANYAKLDGGNTFTGATNTFQEVNATKFSGDGVSSDISEDAVNSGTKLPTCAAVATFVDTKTGTLVQTITALQGKDNDLQSQIDGINAGQNLADIVDTADALAAYDISHLKAKDDQHGADTWAIGDKVQVLGGGNVQSSVYELTKGDMPEGVGNIAVTNWAGYYWHYIGVYGTNAYTKSEIDEKVNTINTNISTKADISYVDTELADKVDKTQIATTISDATATDEKIPSGSAVKTYVDTVANGLPNQYVTLGTAQKITGAKTFANGNITIANPNDAHKDNHYVTIGAAGDNTTSDYTSSIIHYDLTHHDYANDTFTRAKPNTDPKKSSDNVSYTRDLTRYDTTAGKYTFGSKIEQHIGKHYNYIASDMYMTTGDPNEASPLPGAQIGTPGNTGSTDTTLTENYVERIRLRKNTSTAESTAGGFLPAGQSVTDIDLFADNINNVFNNEASFRVCTTADGGAKTDTPVLEIRSTGVYYHTQGVNSLSTTAYQLRTAGSLDFTTNMSQLVGSDAHVPTTKAVADFVDDKIKGVTGGTEFVKTSAPGKNQTIASSVTVNEGLTVGSNDTAANLTVTGIITGNAVATRALDSNGTKLPTEGAVVSFVGDKLTENRFAISDTSKIGAMGLFLYTGGDYKAMGSDVNGSSLHAVGMQLPMDGVVSWSQGDAVNTAAAETTWKLLNNTIAGEPCLVLAIRVG